MSTSNTFVHIQYHVQDDGLACIVIQRAPFNVLDIPTMEEINVALDACAANAKGQAADHHRRRRESVSGWKWLTTRPTRWTA